MKKNLLLLFILPLLTLAQNSNPIDSLNNILKKAAHDTTRCTILKQLVDKTSDDEQIKYIEQLRHLANKNIALNQSNKTLKDIYTKHLVFTIFKTGSMYFQQSEYQKAMECYFTTLKLCAAMGDKTGMGKSMYSLGVLYKEQDDNKKALEYLTNSLKIWEELGDKKWIGRTIGIFGDVSFEQSKFQEALDYYFRSLKISQELSDTKKVKEVLNNIGNVYAEVANYPKSLEYYLKSLKLSEKDGDKLAISNTLSNIGNIYYQHSDLSMALEYYQKSLKISEEIGNKKGLSETYLSIGDVYSNKGNYSKALEYHLKSLKIFEELGIESYVATALSQIGDSYSHQGDYRKALEYFNKSLKINEELETKGEISKSLGNIGHSKMKLGSYKEAEQYLIKALALSTELGQLNDERMHEEYLTELYAETKRFELAFTHNQKAAALRDTIFSQENRKQMVNKEMQYETEKKEILAKAAAEKKEREEQIAREKKEQEEAQQTRWEFMLIGIAIFTLFFVAIYFSKSFFIPEKVKKFLVGFMSMVFFEFIFLASDPYVQKLTGGTPILSITVSVVRAILITPVNSRFEGLIEKLMRKKNVAIQENLE